MATSPAPTPAPSGFDWKSLINVIELAGNVAINVLIPGGAAFAPLLASLEQAVNPLLLSIGTKASVSSEIMTIYGTLIGILTVLKNTPGLPADVLAKVDAYMIAAQNGTGSYLLASKGFDPAMFQPVAPIA